MVTKPSRAVAYKCPNCNSMVSEAVDVFGLAGGGTRVRCECGKSSAALEREKNSVTVTWECLFCGENHTKKIPIKEFLHSPLLAGGCPKNGFGSLYLGDGARVEAAAEEMDEIIDDLFDDMSFDDFFLDNEIFFEVLGILEKIASEDKISCECGERDWELKLEYDAARFVCKLCAAEADIPARSKEDVERIRRTDSVRMTGGRRSPSDAGTADQ